MAKKIKLLLVERDSNLSELAEKIGTTQPNLSNKMKRDDFRVSELNQIAEVLGVKFESYFVLDDERKI
ncbi:MAG: helix-turn-helix domain-containing protein [Psychrobacillus psychrodurans]